MVLQQASVRGFDSADLRGNAVGEPGLGYLVLGYEIDDGVARELSQVAASQVAFLYGNTLVRSTLSPLQETDLIQHAVPTSSRGKARAGRNSARAGTFSGHEALTWPRRSSRQCS